MEKLILAAFITTLVFLLSAQNNSLLLEGAVTNRPHLDNHSSAVDIYAPCNNFSANSKLHAHINNERINQKEQLRWIETTLNEFLQIKKPEKSSLITMRKIDLEDFFLMSYRLMGSGYIQFDNGDWIYMVSNSSHNKEQIGDITLAIDNHGKVFFNEGHICGGVVHFNTSENLKLVEAAHFFQFFMSDTDYRGWTRLNREKSTLSITGN